MVTVNYKKMLRFVIQETRKLFSPAIFLAHHNNANIQEPYGLIFQEQGIMNEYRMLVKASISSLDF